MLKSCPSRQNWASLLHQQASVGHAILHLTIEVGMYEHDDDAAPTTIGLPRSSLSLSALASANRSINIPIYTMTERLKSAQVFMDFLMSEDRESFDGKALHGLKVTEMSPGRCVCSFFVTEGHTNRYNTLHGGCTGSTYLLLFCNFAMQALVVALYHLTAVTTQQPVASQPNIESVTISCHRNPIALTHNTTSSALQQPWRMLSPL